MNKSKNQITPEEKETLLAILKVRFDKHVHRHEDVEWSNVLLKLENNPDKLWSLNEMERTGGEPDVIMQDSTINTYFFYDCSIESPGGRRSICYDREGLDSRKDFKPDNNAVDLAATMGINLLTEQQYRALHEFGKFDAKTSSWIQTPLDIRKLGGALFADFRYGKVFVYHNGAQSYYAARGFRGVLEV